MEVSNASQWQRQGIISPQAFTIYGNVGDDSYKTSICRRKCSGGIPSSTPPLTPPYERYAYKNVALASTPITFYSSKSSHNLTPRIHITLQYGSRRYKYPSRPRWPKDCKRPVPVADMFIHCHLPLPLLTRSDRAISSVTTRTIATPSLKTPSTQPAMASQFHIHMRPSESARMDPCYCKTST